MRLIGPNHPAAGEHHFRSQEVVRRHAEPPREGAVATPEREARHTDAPHSAGHRRQP